jgi:hypothetical protein
MQHTRQNFEGKRLAEALQQHTLAMASLTLVFTKVAMMQLALGEEITNLNNR